MPTQFSSQDLNRIFDAKALTRGRSLGLAGGVDVRLDGNTITGTVMERQVPRSISITPTLFGKRVIFDHRCSCGFPGCAHLAAAAFAALDRFPALRKAEQATFLDTLATPAPEKEKQRIVFELAAAIGPYACTVTTLLIGERSGTGAPTTPHAIATDEDALPPIRDVARMLGEGREARTPITADKVAALLPALIRSGQARWHAGGKRLVPGEMRLFASPSTPSLPPRSGVIVSDIGPWYVDSLSGAVGRVQVRTPAATAAPAAAASPQPGARSPTRESAADMLNRLAASATPPGQPPSRAPSVPFRMSPMPASPAGGLSRGFTSPAGRAPAPAGKRPSTPFSPPRVAAPLPRRRFESREPTEPVIIERSMQPVLRLTRLPCPDDHGRMQMVDALLVEFDYEGAVIAFDDDRQFARGTTPLGPVFIRRDRAAESGVLEAISRDGFVQMRMATAKDAKGRMVFVFRGREAAEAWQGFVAERIPQLQAMGWRSAIDKEFGPRLAHSVGTCDMKIADAPPGASSGAFSLDFGIEIDGVRHPLLPILTRLRDRGGMETARVIDGEVITSLDDGRILKLPADRIARLLTVMDDLLENASRSTDQSMVLEAGAAPSVLDLEDLLTTRWADGAAIAQHVARFRGVAEIPHAPVPESFRGELRPYQQDGVNWLQHLRDNELGGLLADDMGLGKTAQTIAHMCIEQEQGRLDLPVLVVVPTSLVPNWTAELRRFAPHLRLVILHGADRHELRGNLAGVHVVVTTYTVLTRDIEAMADIPWHLVVLDEAQAIKTPGSKATHAVCRLNTRHRISLSGTPIENHLGELWSQFAFLMPGLLGQRKSFAKRFRTPIEKDGDEVRRRQLSTRIKPFILRRTKSAVATELPPKHTILRRITLAPDQRELYETIRATMHEKVTEGIAERGVGQSTVLVLQALLKLRQVCCDPRLAGVPAGQAAASSGKLDDLLEMMGEMIEEGRRILLFSQFTSMLDLIKPALDSAGIRYVELRGDTRDRAEPVRAFEACEVPLFLISLKAGGRGLNLTSADTVIHYDPWWNPAVEDQASDRAHRIGQTKSVFVYKMIAADTVEERILELQDRKAALASLALTEEGMALPAMDRDDIDFLFGAPEEKLAA